MADISLGDNSKLTALVSDRNRIRKFYGEVLGCRVIAKEGADLIRLGEEFCLGVRYDKAALSDEDMLKAIWLELRVDDPAQMKRKILEYGAKEIPYWDKEHFYFQAPGGQVFRLVGRKEDMSKWRS